MRNKVPGDSQKRQGKIGLSTEPALGKEVMQKAKRMSKDKLVVLLQTTVLTGTGCMRAATP